MKRVRTMLVLLGLLASTSALSQTPPSYSAGQLVELVAPIALYPDPLLAQVLAAATFPDQLPGAAKWADEHRDLHDMDLNKALYGTQFPWDPTVQAMLPFPSVLHKLVSDADWARNLGDAFLAQQPDVLNAVQSARATARDLGYLKSNKDVVVGSTAPIDILQANIAVIAVPSYDPAIVFRAKPADQAKADSAIQFEPRVTVGGFRLAAWHSEKFQIIGGYFQAWGWGFGGIDWSVRTVIINGAPWQRNWSNRVDYVHPYPQLARIPPHE